MEFVKCFNCGKGLDNPVQSGNVCLVLTQPPGQTEQRTHNLYFHIQCFKEVAGSEYLDALRYNPIRDAIEATRNFREALWLSFKMECQNCGYMVRGYNPSAQCERCEQFEMVEVR